MDSARFSIHIFCRIVDNFGDAGVSWRLARQFVREHNLAVTLWIDDISCLARFCPFVDVNFSEQKADGINLRVWKKDFFEISFEIPDVVIEVFGCGLPNIYIEKMVGAQKKPVWINLEYLSAESWVDDYHAKVSPHPRFPLNCYFFFPGFTDKTGGLIKEKDFNDSRFSFLRDTAAQNAFWEKLGIAEDLRMLKKVSLFCYRDAPVSDLFSIFEKSGEKILCLVPEGVAEDAVRNFLGKSNRVTQNSLIVRVIPFLTQEYYDKLLCLCDFNFVRGEDSFVRAQWAGRPFVWNIYFQSENAHVKKLDAFLALYTEKMGMHERCVVINIHKIWNKINEVDGFINVWYEFFKSRREIMQHNKKWVLEIENFGDLASNLLKFIKKIG